MSNAFKPIALTMGDVAGIGPEIIAQSFRDAADQTVGCVVVGDVSAIQRAIEVLHDAHPNQPRLTLLPLSRLQDLPTDVPSFTVPVLQVSSERSAAHLPAWGHVSGVAGQWAADAVTWAANAALRGEVSAIVTAPLHKEALAAAGVPFPGHTELLQACAAMHAGVAVSDMPVRMMLANDELRTVLVSIHVSLRDAIEAVTAENILQTLRITHQAQLRVTGQAPHMGVAGLNPHAGEGGLLGREELDIIIPALQQARAEGMWVSGPFAPDTVFMRARSTPDKRGEFDVVIAMYHDQGLIPVKYLGVDEGVNVTLGLPLVRTSPDHGTAFDLAGTGKASPASFLAALAMARKLAA
jgi:4-hydroxythreonine-4-phosphate dehydrogenase